MEWSGPELILLFVIALVVLGPERMAQVAKKIGKFIGYARRMSRNLQVQLEDELEMKQIRDSLPTRVDLKKELGIDKLEQEVNKLNDPVLPAAKPTKPVESIDAPQTAGQTPEIAAAPGNDGAPQISASSPEMTAATNTKES